MRYCEISRLLVKHQNIFLISLSVTLAIETGAEYPVWGYHYPPVFPVDWHVLWTSIQDELPLLKSQIEKVATYVAKQSSRVFQRFTRISEEIIGLTNCMKGCYKDPKAEKQSFS